MLEIIIPSLDLLAFGANLLLAFFIFRHNPRRATNKYFALFGLALAFWNLANFLLLVFKSVFAFRLTYALGTLVPLTGFFFLYSFLGEKFPRLVKIVVGILSLVFFALSFTDLLVKKSFALSAAGTMGEQGPFFDAWALFIFLTLIFFLSKSFSAYLKSTGTRKRQFSYLLMGLGLASLWIALVSLVLPTLGYSFLNNTDSPVTLLITGFTAYAIAKYHLLDIRILISRLLVSSLIIGIGSGFLIGLILLGSWFFPVLGYAGITLMSFLVAFFAFLIGKMFFRERRLLQEKSQKLEEAKAKLEEINTVLEIRVRARTSQLKEQAETLKKKNEEKTKELKERFAELEKFHKLTVGRELKMIELKKEIERLKEKIKESQEPS